MNKFRHLENAGLANTQSDSNWINEDGKPTAASYYGRCENDRCDNFARYSDKALSVCPRCNHALYWQKQNQRCKHRAGGKR